MPRCLRRGWMASNVVNVFKKVAGFHVAVMPHPLGVGIGPMRQVSFTLLLPLRQLKSLHHQNLYF